MPDFQRHGESSYFCKLAVQEYCSDISSTFVSDPGCFVHPIDDDNAPVPLRFDCKSNLTSDCYGAGLNFGSSTPGGYSCSTQPFRDATQLQDTGLYDICRRLQCDDNGVTYIDMADYWRYLEWYFALLFTLEQMAGFFVHRNKLVFFQDPIVLIDICTLVTFYYLELIAILNSTPVSYAIPPGSTDILTILQMLRIGRIYKLYRVSRELSYLFPTSFPLRICQTFILSMPRLIKLPRNSPSRTFSSVSRLSCSPSSCTKLKRVSNVSQAPTAI